MRISTAANLHFRPDSRRGLSARQTPYMQLVTWRNICPRQSAWTVPTADNLSVFCFVFVYTELIILLIALLLRSWEIDFKKIQFYFME